MEMATKNRNNLVLGIWIIMIPVIIIGMVMTKAWTFLLGGLIGSIASSLLAIHMYLKLDEALDLDEEHAIRHTQKASMIRSLIMFVLLVGSYYFREWISPVGVFLGLMGLKISAYLNPFLGRIGTKNNIGEKE